MQVLNKRQRRLSIMWHKSANKT